MLVYEARTALAVGRTIINPNPSSGDLYLGQQLAGVYANFAQRGQVEKATMDALGLNRLPEHVIRALPNTRLSESRSRTAARREPRLLPMSWLIN